MPESFVAPGERELERGVGVADPEDYLLTRRLRQIMDARDRVAETIRERKDEVVDDTRQGGITRAKYRELVADVLIEYLIEIEPILRHDDLDEDVTVWTDRITTDPAGGSITLGRIVEEGGIVPDGNGNEVPLPVDVSRAAYRAANRFLTNVGFGVRLDSGLPSDDGFDATADRGRERESDIVEDDDE